MTDLRGTLLRVATLLVIAVGCSAPGPGLSASDGSLDVTSPSGHALTPSSNLPFRPAVILPVPPLTASTADGVPLDAFSGRDAALEDVLLSLFAGSELNILVGDEVRQTLSFDVKATTMEGAFASLLGHLDLAWHVKGDYVVVERQEQRTWPVELPAVTTDDGTSALDVQAQLWDELEAEVSLLLGSHGQVVARPAAGTLEVVAPPSLLDLVADQVDAFQRTLLRPVSLTARRLEVHLPDGAADLDWQALAAALGTSTPPRDGALDLGLAGVGGLVSALAAQGELHAGPLLSATTRNGSPARLELPDSRGEVLSLRLLPRAADDGSIDLSLEREVGRADEVARMGSARMTLSSGRALALAGPVRDVTVEEDVPALGGLFHSTQESQRRVATVLILEPTVGETGLALGTVPPTQRESGHLLDREPLASTTSKTASITRSGLSAALYDAGCQALTDGHDRRALGLFRRATELDPARSDAWLHAAAIELRTGRADEARRLAGHALLRNGDDVLALTVAGLADLAEGVTHDALARLQRAYSLKPCAVTATNLSAAMLEAGDLERARLVLSESFPLELELFEPHLDRAYVHLADGELSAARTALLSATTLGAPAADQRMVTLQSLVHALEQSLGLVAIEGDQAVLPAGIEGLVDPDRSPNHFLSGWH